MSVDAVKAHLKKYGMQDRFMEFSVSSATVELAAAAIGCTPGEIAKTLAFYLNEGCLLIVAAGNTKIDNKKFKETFGVKAKMLRHRMFCCLPVIRWAAFAHSPQGKKLWFIWMNH